MHDRADSEGDHRIHLETHVVAPPHELGLITRFDNEVDRALDRLRGTEPVDRILYSITELGDFGLVWLLIGSARALRDDDRLREGLRLITCMGIESVLVNGVIKQLFKRERPVLQAPRPYRIRIPLTTSFPSGHASAAAVAAILLSERSRAKPLYWGLAALVAMSRVHVRIHHASDVVGGVALGAVVGVAAKRIWPLPPPGSSRWRGDVRRRG